MDQATLSLSGYGVSIFINVLHSAPGPGSLVKGSDPDSSATSVQDLRSAYFPLFGFLHDTNG